VQCAASLSFWLCLARVDVPIRPYRVVFLLSLRYTRIDVPIQPARIVVVFFRFLNRLFVVAQSRFIFFLI
jgi:hypothetical protein